MRILVGYSYYRSFIDVRDQTEAWLTRLRSYGFDVRGIPITTNPPGPPVLWPELDRRWRWGDPVLFRMYERLAEAASECDVFLNFNGINTHPEFIKQLNTFNVYACFDDPESSERLSRPLAPAYDLAMVGNVAEVGRYVQWGVQRARHWPLGFRADQYDPALTSEQILSGDRDVDVALLCERITGWRGERLSSFCRAFPAGRYHGRGWPAGVLPQAEKVPLYQRTRIGVNFHNSTGPINFRTFELPANGVLLVCDNKAHLGKLFQLGREAVGFETPQEAVEVCRYYLSHDAERREIAACGWQRAVRDYSERAVFESLERAIGEVLPSVGPARENARIELPKRAGTGVALLLAVYSCALGCRAAVKRALGTGLQIARSAVRKCTDWLSERMAI
jgi:spore maturation protein CgeB